MSQLTLYLKHHLGQEVARSRLKCRISELAGQYAGDIANLNFSWSDNIGTFCFTVRGIRAQGRVTVYPREIDLTGECSADDLDLGQVEAVIREQTIQLLA